jgi:hypothetical protein
MSSLGYKHTEEAKKRIGEAQKGKVISWETRRKTSKSEKGKKISQETRRRLSVAHKGLSAGSKHPNWKGGKYKECNGYVQIWMPSHPHADKRGYIREHRLVMEKVLGRYLESREIVHHKNGLKGDNRPENLRLTNNSDHIKERLEKAFADGFATAYLLFSLRIIEENKK